MVLWGEMKAFIKTLSSGWDYIRLYIVCHYSQNSGVNEGLRREKQTHPKIHFPSIRQTEIRGKETCTLLLVILVFLLAPF